MTTPAGLFFTRSASHICASVFIALTGLGAWFHGATFGAAPMFFYVLHLYVLKAGYLVAYALYGPNQGEYLSVPNLGVLWLLAAALSVPLYFPTRGFARWKRRRRDLAWLRYF